MSSQNNSTAITINLSTADIKDLVQHATAMFQKGELIECEKFCRATLQHRGDNSEILHLLGELLARGNRASEAIALFDRAIALAPGDYGLLMSTGRAHWAAKHFSKSHACFAQAVALIRQGTAGAVPEPFRLVAVTRASDNHGNDELFEVASFLARRCPSTQLAQFMVVCGLIQDSPSEWNEYLHDKLLVPALKLALADSSYQQANTLQACALNLFAVRPHTAAQWKRSFDATNAEFIAAGARIRASLPKLDMTDRRAEKPRIAFIVDGAIANSGGVDLFVSTLRDLTAVDHLEPLVFAVENAPDSLIQCCAQLGVALVEFDKYLGTPHLTQGIDKRLLSIREHARALGVCAAVVMSTFEGWACLATGIGLAPIQFYLTMGFHSIKSPYIDAYFSFAALNRGVREIEGTQWRTVHWPYPNPFPPSGSPEYATLRSKADAIRKDLLGKYDLILGTIGRADKIDREFVSVLADIMWHAPNVAFLWFGKALNGSVQQWLEEYGIHDRCVFAGWVDTKVYAHVLDIHLDPFGIPTGLTMGETFSAGGAYSLLVGDESRDMTLTAALLDLMDEQHNGDPSYEAMRKTFYDERAQPRYLMLAHDKAEYVANVKAMIDSPSLRASVGSAALGFMRACYHDTTRFGDALATSMVQCVAEILARQDR
jgi:hypothetical protein